MKRMWEVYRYELKRGGRRKGYLLATFGVPLIGILIVVGIRLAGTLPAFNTTQMISQAMEQVSLAGIASAGLIDETGQFAPHVQSGSELIVFPDQDSANAAMQARDIEGYYIIPADYMETGKVTLVLPSMNISEISSAPVKALIVSTLAEGVDPQVADRLLSPSSIQVTNVSLTTGATATSREEGMAGGAFVLVYILALVMMISLFVTNGYLMQSVIEEKETRLIEILLASIRSTDLLSGKILANGSLGLFQLLIWLGGMIIGIRLAGGNELGEAMSIFSSIANIQIPWNNLPLIIVYFLLAYLMFAGFYGMIGAISNSMREGPQYAALLTLPAVIPLMFLPVFVEDPSGGMAVALSLFPLTSPLAMSMRLMISDVPFWQIVISLTLLALTGFGMVWAAGRVFRVQVLLAGKSPSLRDLPKLVRGG
ncbi:MAG: ABC transporter permease [Anaerolineae bacterium]